KTGEPKGSVGSNPTPSAITPVRYFRIGVMAFQGLGPESLRSSGFECLGFAFANFYPVREAHSAPPKAIPPPPPFAPGYYSRAFPFYRRYTAEHQDLWD
ncbi:MAG: hypothetical protein NWR51_09265, partial [Akkermansiaceae bacterium]|nr:hypothetical protein [Akkermansiaceae bacterium]MDP4721616.1 hypothetical protein [Akkermansiaceae bacterium]MDP4847437.1 hypothetical protein [Akkermansiaceae bacterium]MDP4899242.1 hypothetical protein [Akkermansiaceae bacterium]